MVPSAAVIGRHALLRHARAARLHHRPVSHVAPDLRLPPPEFIRTATYETLFALSRAPIGNYVFTDLDRLTGFEIDAATEIAKSLVAADPTVHHQLAQQACWPLHAAAPAVRGGAQQLQCLAPGRGAGAGCLSGVHPA